MKTGCSFHARTPSFHYRQPIPSPQAAVPPLQSLFRDDIKRSLGFRKKFPLTVTF